MVLRDKSARCEAGSLDRYRLGSKMSYLSGRGGGSIGRDDPGALVLIDWTGGGHSVVVV